MKRISLFKVAKIAVGLGVSTAIAYGLNLDFFVSAGIITLLTIQDTRQETIAVTLKRTAAFLIVTVLCMSLFGLIGFYIPVLALIAAIFLAICMALEMNEAIAMNCVIATHYFALGECSSDVLMNETLLIIIGAGTGVLLNIFIPVNIMKIRKIQNETDERIKSILNRMSVYIFREDKSDYTGSCFIEMDGLLKDLQRAAALYWGNGFGSGRDYFMKYCHMRMDQCEILKRIYGDIMRLECEPKYGDHIGEFLQRMSSEFHEINDATGLLKDIESLFKLYSEQSLPESRSEFESRAIMYHILCDLKYFVELKAEFASALSEGERKKFWVNA